MLKDLKKAMDRVKYLLEKYPETRDCDKTLWLAYNCVFMNLQKHCEDYYKFREWLLQGDVPVFESLSRARRKIQEELPSLRGKSWKPRQGEEQAVREWSRG